MLHQFIFWSCQKKAVPLQRISNNNWRMKTVLQNLATRMLLFLLWFVSIVLMFIACSPLAPGVPDAALPGEFATADVLSEQLPFILADTVTPPSNPMAPEDLSSYPTFAGVLTLLPCDFMNINGKYVCGIRLATPIQYISADEDTFIYTSIYLLDRDNLTPVRFNHPMLKSCVVGDTIFVTGTPMEISNGVALGLTMYFVQPQ